MLAEIWATRRDGSPIGGPPVDTAHGAAVYLPADTANHADHCFRIDDRDWRYLARFRTAGAGPKHCDAGGFFLTPFDQTKYRFGREGAEQLLAAADPLPEDCDAG